MQTNRLFPLSLLALAALVHAQEAAQTQLPAVTITGRNLNAPVNVGGFGDTPNARLPLQALRVGGSVAIVGRRHPVGVLIAALVDGFAQAEGLPAHGQAITARFND